MTKQEVEAKVLLSIAVTCCGNDLHRLPEDALNKRLDEDYGMDSLEKLNFILDLAREFGDGIYDTVYMDKVHTPQDAVTGILAFLEKQKQAA